MGKKKSPEPEPEDTPKTPEGETTGAVPPSPTEAQKPELTEPIGKTPT
jgi:hypothetical protein